ncbi:MAG: biotin--[acetyl-CoA-carboxylase] ligase [Clostridiales bacterium 43-6]|nr:MAG: biotin--[acetyl-CoA-carboxylase] ligase [Clostridiales bacterium 43-6]
MVQCLREVKKVKEQVLSILEENRGKSMKGSDIAASLGYTRSAIWKAVTALKNDGYHIESVTNRGYLLCEDNDLLSVTGIKKFLNTTEFGKTIMVYKTVGSTNHVAKQAASEGAENGTVIVSEEQTAGKGRMGRSFYSPSQKGIYMSVVVKPRLTAAVAPLITAYTAVAVSKAIETQARIETKIKWVNDIYKGDKKVCGILTEASVKMENGELEYIIIGIGINTSVTDFPEDLKDIAGSVSEAGFIISRNRLVAEILNELESGFVSFLDKSFISEYKSRSLILGKEIKIFGSGNEADAVALEIDDNCNLVIRKTDGTIETLNSGEVSVKRKEKTT